METKSISSLDSARRLSGGRPNGASKNTSSKPANFELYLVEESGRVLERSAGYERYLEDIPLGEEARDADTRVLDVISNVGKTVRERIDFWKEAEAASRKASCPVIELRPSEGTHSEWAALALDQTVPLGIAQMVRSIAVEGAKSQGGDAPIQARSKQKKCVRIELKTDEEVGWAQGLGNRFGKLRGDRMVHYCKPRGAWIQEQQVYEIPADVGEAGARAIATDLAARLKPLGVPFSVVLHVPTSRNHARNVHLHVTLHPGRPVQLANGSWEFAIARGAGKKLRPGEIARQFDPTSKLSSNAKHWELAAADVAAMRSAHAACCNRHLEKAGSRLRYDPRTYAEMEIRRAPQIHLGSAAALLVEAGCLVKIDLLNARRAYEDNQHVVSKRAVQRTKELARTSSLLGEEILRLLLGSQQPPTPDLAHLQDLKFRYIVAAEDLVSGCKALERLDLERETARSAALRLAENLDRILADIRAGAARPEEARQEAAIQRRLELAKRHLAEIDSRVEHWEEEISNFRAEMVIAATDVDRLAVEAKEAVASSARTRQERQSSLAPREVSPSPQVCKASPSPHDMFDAVMSRIRDHQSGSGNKIYISRTPDGSGYAFDGLSNDDIAAIEHPAVRKRALPFLDSEADKQSWSITRLVTYARKHGAAALTALKKSDGSPAPDAIANLYLCFPEHPLLLRQLERLTEQREVPKPRLSHRAETEAAFRPDPVRVDALAVPVSQRLTDIQGAPICERGGPPRVTVPGVGANAQVNSTTPTLVDPPRVASASGTMSSIPAPLEAKVSNAKAPITVTREVAETTPLGLGVAADGASQGAAADGGDALNSVAQVPSHSEVGPPLTVNEKFAGSPALELPGVPIYTSPEPMFDQPEGRDDRPEAKQLPARTRPLRQNLDNSPALRLPISEVSDPSDAIPAGTRSDKKPSAAMVMLRDAAKGRTDKMHALASERTKAVAPLADLSKAGGTRKHARRDGRSDQENADKTALQSMKFLPLRRVMIKGRQLAFEFVPPTTAEDDRALAARVNARKTDPQLQSLLAESWRAMITHLESSLTIDRDQRPAVESVAELFSSEPQMQIAIRAAGRDPDVVRAIECATEYWDAQELSLLSMHERMKKNGRRDS